MSGSQKQAELLMEASKDGTSISEETRKKRKIQITGVKLQWKDSVLHEKLATEQRWIRTPVKAALLLLLLPFYLLFKTNDNSFAGSEYECRTVGLFRIFMIVVVSCREDATQTFACIDIHQVY